MALFANFSIVQANNFSHSTIIDKTTTVDKPVPVDKRTKFASIGKVYNWASFLNLREAPHPDATVLALLPFGTTLTVAAEQPDSRPFASELVPNYKPFENENVLYPGRSIEGNWLKVNYEGFVGYVFDGYISEIRPYRKSSREENWEVLENFISKKYPGSFAELIEEENTDRIVTQDEDLEYRFSQDDYSATHEMVIKNVNMDEALMVATKLFKIQGVKSVAKDQIGLFIENDFNCTLTVKEEEGGSRIILSFWDGGC